MGRLFTILLVFLVLLCPDASGEDVISPLPQLKEVETAGPYCGIYSLVACLDAYSLHPDIKELLSPDYVGSFQGSSNEEIIKAAEKYGLYGKTFSGLGWKELKTASSPMILHFRSTYADRQYNHWVTFLGLDGEFARIIDLPHQIAAIPPAELMAQWDGTGIEISNRPTTNYLLYAAKANYAILVTVMIGIALVLHLFWKRSMEAFAAPTLFLRFKRSVAQTSLLLVSFFVFGILYHAIFDVGFLRNPSAVSEVTRRYYSVNVPEISIVDLRKIIAEKSASLFDARFVRDYNAGTIPGAVSLAIHSNLNERKEILASLPKSERIVVFCQSSGCGYADEIAQFLKFNGYHNVAIYRGGYRDWKSQTEAP